MGRKTFESFPKPLPNRVHIVISRDADYKKAGVITTQSMEEAIAITANDEQPFIIGGGEIYTIGLDIADKIELTRVHGNFEADTFFPDIPKNHWQLITEEFHDKDERHNYAFTYQTWIKK